MALPQMSNDDLDVAAAIILTILQRYEPIDRSTILLLAHARLWAACGKGSTATMIRHYTESFVALTELFKDDQTPLDQTLQ